MGDPVLTPSAVLAWTIANRIAINTKSKIIYPIHVFLAILQILDEGYYREAEDLGLTQEQLFHLKSEIDHCKAMIGLTTDQITKLSRSIRRQLPMWEEPGRVTGFLHRSDETRKLFKYSKGSDWEKSCGIVSVEYLLAQLIPMYQAGIFTHRLVRYWEKDGENEQTNEQNIELGGAGKSSSRLLETIGRDLTELARNGRLNSVVGREEEIIAIARILNRTSKRNVILIGEAGVGKTAVVEGLAQKCVSLKAPKEIRNLHIFQINVSDLISGTSYRGEMEARLKQLISDATSDPNIVLFIDEIHLVMRAGTTVNSAMDIANILKPALARGDFRCIGATTLDEYDRYIKEDTAFLRRFQTLHISEPSPEMAIQICSEWAKSIENKLNVNITPEAIREAVSLSIKHMPARRLPDKAIDLLENAAAYVKISSLEVNNVFSDRDSDTPLVGIDQIHSILTNHYQISLNTQRLFCTKDIETRLREEIVGQDKAIEVFIRWVDLIRLRESETSTTLGTLLFYGPPGVGKSFFTECVAKAMDEQKGLPLLRLNMSDYKESYDLSRLTGAAPGLVGHERQTPFIHFVDTHPQGIILMDGLENAHPDIINFVSSIFETGEIRDSRGRVFHFRNYLFILLSDIKQNGKEDDQEELLQRNFPQEFLNHFDLIVPFRKLSVEDYHMLFTRRIESLRNMLMKSKGLEILIDEATSLNIVISLAEQSGSVRKFLRKMEQVVVGRILQYLELHQEKTTITITWHDNTICIL